MTNKKNSFNPLPKTPDGLTLLHAAATSNHPAAMQRACQLGIDINSADNRGITAVHLAALSGKVQMLDAALELGADIKTSAEGCNVIHFATHSGNLAQLQHLESLLDAEFIRKTLTQSAHCGLTMIQNGMGILALKWAQKHGFDLKQDIDNADTNLLLVAARQSRQRNIDVFNYLLEQNVPVKSNQHGETIVHMAVLSGSPNLLRLAHETLILKDPASDPITQDYMNLVTYSFQSKNPLAIQPVLAELHDKMKNTPAHHQPVRVAFI